MNKLLKLTVIALLSVQMSGCAVMMAMHGKPEVQTSALHRGQPREEVLFIVGQEPYKTFSTETGRIDIFECERGNAPNAGRAACHAVMDVLTWGAWEIIGTPVEAMTSSKFYLTVEYNSNDKVISLKTSEKDK